ncbi:MAG: DHA2 family efflux MFS transporter permease subunit [Intrasporangium sp.]|uniref:DHA2 family efflux MFS transporter permease subunit n=1 Tax=Intrasporangium sp. TaxID=1925024 RepID=UPI00264907F9|nr:DHA2 family efflux MFS transporter permease subunit [Intrasporangium sp.]MDN5797806.1 DHA2 family efflux MFS transporter permease subunit [Intrasporangium sp.]
MERLEGSRTSDQTSDLPEGRSPWPALWAMVLGFFMILVDSTIVSVATPAIMIALDADVNAVVWVTSAYLLAYAVPLLITGRLGDRYGPKRLYLLGLTIFTLASLWCGLTGTITMLVIARVVQGLGASLLTPQTMAVITRTFPAASRGKAMALWGATAGVAMLVGPIAGGVLVDGPGWEWIFFVNVPVGVFGLLLAVRLVPRLGTHTHSFDWLGVVLSAIGMFLLVFGIQEGESYDWGAITGIVSVPLLIAVGLVVLGAFIWWQNRNPREPLVPLSLFRDRNFGIANIAISTVGFAITAMTFPFMLYAQAVRGMTPTAAALLLAPMALLSAALAPLAGTLTDRLHPRGLTAFGIGATTIALFWLSQIMHEGTPTWELLLPMILMGLGGPFMWSPIGATATRNLPMSAAGAGAGVYNTTRQVGAVLGSAAIAVIMEARLAIELPGVPTGGGSFQTGGTMPAEVASGFADAMAQSMILPAAVLLVGFVAVLFFERPLHQVA